jgi:hypothetical protein
MNTLKRDLRDAVVRQLCDFCGLNFRNEDQVGSFCYSCLNATMLYSGGIRQPA